MTLLKLKRCLAFALALMLSMPLALAEQADWTAETPFEEAPVPEQGELALPGDSMTEALPGEAAVEAAPGTDGEADAQPQAAVAPEAPDAGEQAVAAPSDAGPVVAVSEMTLGVKESRALGLANGADPVSVGAFYATSNPKIARVDERTGVVTGKKAGTATIVLTVQGVQSACAVTVVKAPKKITLPAKKLTLGVGEEIWLTPTLSPGNTSTTVTFSTSNGGVAMVDDSGRVVATGVGTATVTAMTSNKKKAKCKLTVKAAPEYVALGASMLSLWQGRSYDLNPVLSPGSGGTLYYASSDPNVVSVEGASIRALNQGTATVTVTAYNGCAASAQVQVTKAPVYRALLVGETHFPDSGMANLPGGNDVAMVARMLGGVKGPAGSDWAVTSHTDLTASQLHSAIREAFAGAAEGDVSLFYISSHGDESITFDSNYPQYAGYLQTYPDFAYSNWYDRNTVTLVALASWLSEVPGQVVVLIDSCGSGAAIYNAKGVSAAQYTPDGFDEAVVDAFRDADKGVMAPGVDQGAFVLENKFYVLTSADYLETGWSLKGKYSYFSKWLTDAIKTKGKMPADADRNHYTTLNELYNYMAKKASRKVFKYRGGSYRQHVQVYPSGSGFELFYR